MKTITIDQLICGMYVVDAQGAKNLKVNGVITSETQIEQLRKKGVRLLKIDSSKQQALELDSSEESQFTQAISAADTPSLSVRQSMKKLSMAQELKNAQLLYSEAKSLQARAFADITNGKAVSVADFRRCAEGFIDSVFRNQDALLCISRIRDKDAYLLEHSVNVSILMSIFAKYLKLDEDIIVELATGALLHDIGKIKVPNTILNKPGRLTEAEFVIMRKHVEFSRDILQQTEGISPISIDVAANHHERLDGNGYPAGLAQEQISFYARMIAIVDTYDAITAQRVYKSGQSCVKALKILRTDSPSHFDLALVKQFIAAVGMYPPGTLVLMDSEKLALVLENNPNSLTCPKVKVFYNVKQRRYLTPVTVDLANAKCNDAIKSAVSADEYGIDINKFFNQFILQS
ncbi:HD-GYP domain-containing protein [Rheinheimera baltica]|uniref:HD-GYP domain-containing protein n=1 Tax=Rheinheimera baltica TaxID=67576 RepID=UPI00273E2EA6|nr:HD-GYP domain-containing protein [Rheinheimera baltica]MDP5190699.1 HD-GYP domain-containing protein [Rheinheimera baltica]